MMIIFHLTMLLYLIKICNFHYFSFLFVIDYLIDFMLIFNSSVLFLFTFHEFLHSSFLFVHPFLLILISLFYFYFFHFIFILQVTLFSENCYFFTSYNLILVLTVNFIIYFLLFTNFQFYLCAI